MTGASPVSPFTGLASLTAGLRRDGTARRDLLLGAGGDDTLLGYGGNDDLRGGDGADLLAGGIGDDVIGWLGTPRPIPTGEVDPGQEAGDDTMLGGAGNDIIGGGAGNDTLLGGEGNDHLLGGTGRDLLLGGAGADFATGGDDSDVLAGGVGDDNLHGEDGNDTLQGGDGNDGLHGGNGLDRLLGGAGEDSLLGGTGADTLAGGVGRDRAEGGADSDLLDGGAGADTLFGEDGDDWLFGNSDGDLLFGGAGADTLAGGAGDDLLVGGIAATMPAASALPDIDPGADMLFGGDGADTLVGGAGADRLGGGTGNDLLRGGDGADTLVGGSGLDTLTGGAGDDLFVLRPGDAATITDFRAGGGSIALTFDGLEAGTIVPDRLGGLAWGAVTDLETGELDLFNPVTVREGGSVRALAGTLGISDPEGRAFVVEGGIVIKAAFSHAYVHTFRDGQRLETFTLDHAASRPDLAVALAGMQPADHIEIEGRTNIGNLVMSVPLDSLGIRYVEPPGQDLLRVTTHAQAAGLLASAADVAGGVAMAFDGISVTLPGRSAAEASLDWFG